MKYRLRDVPELLRTPLGRRELWQAPHYRAWRLWALLAEAHRRTLARRARVVAVVGSLGKSTTTRAVRAALGLAEPAEPAEPRINGGHFLAQSVLRLPPGPATDVFEVAIRRPGQMAIFARMVRPDVVVATSVGNEHRLSLRTLEVTRAEKARMVERLPAAGLAVLNGDDPNVRWMATRSPAPVRTYGFGPDNDVRALDYALDWPAGSRFVLETGGARREVRSRLLGRHQVYAPLAAITVGLALGRALDQILPDLAELPATPGRLEPVPLDNGAWLLRDDYKGTIESTYCALDVLAEIPARRRIVVLGPVSESPLSAHETYRRLGARLAEVADRVVMIGEFVGHLAPAARRAGLPAEALIAAGQTPLAVVELLRGLIEPGDVVLIKGRGNQHLARIGLALAGRPVRCDIPRCDAPAVECRSCPMLERGWTGRRVLI